MMRTAVSCICFALFPASVKVLVPASSLQWAESAAAMDSVFAEQVKSGPPLTTAVQRANTSDA
jgi:hypothetical protein